MCRAIPETLRVRSIMVNPYKMFSWFPIYCLVFYCWLHKIFTIPGGGCSVTFSLSVAILDCLVFTYDVMRHSPNLVGDVQWCFHLVSPFWIAWFFTDDIIGLSPNLVGDVQWRFHLVSPFWIAWFFTDDVMELSPNLVGDVLWCFHSYPVSIRHESRFAIMLVQWIPTSEPSNSWYERLNWPVAAFSYWLKKTMATTTHSSEGNSTSGRISCFHVVLKYFLLSCLLLLLLLLGMYATVRLPVS